MTSSIARAPAPTYRTILLPFDGTGFAAGAVPTARALAARFEADIHVVTVAISDFEVDRVRREAAAAIGTDPEDRRVHVEVGEDVGAGVRRCAERLDACLICLSTHSRGRVSGTLVGSTARDIIDRAKVPVVVAGPNVVDPDAQDHTIIPPLGADHLVACLDGTPDAERGIPVAAAWADALGMKLTLLTVAEPCPPPLRLGAPWRRHHGPNEDADEYVRRVGERWALDAPGLETVVVYDPISVADGIRTYVAEHPTGLLAVTSHLHPPLPHLVLGSGAAQVVHASTAPVLVIPVTAPEA